MVEQLVDTVDDLAAKVDEMVAELMTTGPMAVAKAKELTLNFDRWASNDDELRQWTLDYTSRMRASDEGQEGLSSFLENKDANWKSGSK